MPNDSLDLGVFVLAVVDGKFMGPSELLGDVAALFSCAYRRSDMLSVAKTRTTLEDKQLAHVTNMVAKQGHARAHTRVG